LPVAISAFMQALGAQGCFWPADGGKHKPCLIMFCGRQGGLGKYVVANSYGGFRSSRLANQAKSEVCRSSDMGERLAVTVPDAREPSRPLTRLHRMAKSGRTPHPIFGVPYQWKSSKFACNLNSVQRERRTDGKSILALRSSNKSGAQRKQLSLS
jgi:hypothetical protein